MELGDSCWWDYSANWLINCRKVDRSCDNCFAVKKAATVLAHDPLYRGRTKRLKDGRWAWHGPPGVLPPGHRSWTLPLKIRPAPERKLGPGMPALVALNLMGDTFYEKHSDADIDRGLMTVAASENIGLLLTRRPQRMLAYFLALERQLSPEALRRWQAHLWLGVSCGHQEEFNKYWPLLRQLALRGWTTFLSLAPLIDEIVLSDDCLALVKWVIVSGEKAAHKHCRYMKPAWARALLAQCRAAGIPFFMKIMSRDEHIPLDLLVRQFPRVDQTIIKQTVIA